MLNECIICNEQIISNKVKYNCTTCNVVYHYDCLKTWINFNNVCPICRKCTRLQHLYNTPVDISNQSTFNPIVVDDIATEIVIGIPVDQTEIVDINDHSSFDSLPVSPHMSSFSSVSSVTSLSSLDLDYLEQYLNRFDSFDMDTSDDASSVDESISNGPILSSLEDFYIIRL